MMADVQLKLLMMELGDPKFVADIGDMRSYGNIVGIDQCWYCFIYSNRNVKMLGANRSDKVFQEDVVSMNKNTQKVRWNEKDNIKLSNLFWNSNN